jgi:hypothetical protein
MTDEQREKKKESQTRYCAAHPGKVRESKRAWQKRNAEKGREASKRYYVRNPERVRAKEKRYREENKEKVLENARKAHALRFAADPGKYRRKAERYRKAHVEELRVKRNRYHAERRKAVLNHYGNRCSWPGCNVTDPDMLQIDHVNGGGLRHRKELGCGPGGSGTTVCAFLIKNNFPPGFRILCANHNWKHKANLERAKAGILRVS